MPPPWHCLPARLKFHFLATICRAISDEGNQLAVYLRMPNGQVEFINQEAAT
jgi:hypothetical protein